MTQVETQQNYKAVVRRTYAASPERVFEAWTQPALLAKWYVPNERWAGAEAQVDLRVGGGYKIVMRHSDGDEFIVAGKYQEIVPPTKLVFTFLWEKNSMSEDLGETLVTIDIARVAGGSELTLTHERFTSSETAEAHEGGWTGMIDSLERFLAAQ